MKQIKLAIRVGIILVLFSLVLGCTKKDADENKFIIFQSKVEITAQLEEAAKAYQAETGVEIEVWSTTGDDYFHQFQPSVFRLLHNADYNIGFFVKFCQFFNDLIHHLLQLYHYRPEIASLSYLKSDFMA